VGRGVYGRIDEEPVMKYKGLWAFNNQKAILSL
jgi:hypothetical protein